MQEWKRKSDPCLRSHFAGQQWCLTHTGAAITALLNLMNVQERGRKPLSLA